MTPGHWLVLLLEIAVILSAAVAACLEFRRPPSPNRTTSTTTRFILVFLSLSAASALGVTLLDFRIRARSSSWQDLETTLSGRTAAWPASVQDTFFGSCRVLEPPSEILGQLPMWQTPQSRGAADAFLVGLDHFIAGRYGAAAALFEHSSDSYRTAVATQYELASINAQLSGRPAIITFSRRLDKKQLKLLRDTLLDLRKLSQRSQSVWVYSMRAAFEEWACVLVSRTKPDSLALYEEDLEKSRECIWATQAQARIAKAPPTALAVSVSASILLHRGDVEGAMAAYRSAAEEQKCELLQFGLGTAMLLHSGKEDHATLGLAIQHLREVVEKVPDFCPGWVQLGNALAWSGNDDGALKAYGAGVACDPDDSSALFSLGTQQREAGRNSDALSTLLRARDADALHAETRVQLALTYEALGNTDQAIIEAEMAKALAPEYSAIVFDLGTFYCKKERVVEARVSWDEFLSRGSEEPRLRRLAAAMLEETIDWDSSAGRKCTSILRQVHGAELDAP